MTTISHENELQGMKNESDEAWDAAVGNIVDKMTNVIGEWERQQVLREGTRFDLPTLKMLDTVCSKLESMDIFLGRFMMEYEGFRVGYDVDGDGPVTIRVLLLLDEEAEQGEYLDAFVERSTFVETHNRDGLVNRLNEVLGYLFVAEKLNWMVNTLPKEASPDFTHGFRLVITAQRTYDSGFHTSRRCRLPTV